MADEIHTTRDPDGTTHTTTVIDREPRRGGGMGLGLILLVAIVIAGFFAFQFLANDKAESGAITEAAQKVGDAAENVGDAAQEAVK
ncbi:hypothetical protein [Sphingopyxis macrogoltabida]|uniref:Uncharacterized protein n=1 Tax=Sphingopyxis macrogoltabida TaxID=33050 RepID=A0A0P0DNZ9_SPHMC|nr:hypothetical protein [Sphingopyxis macrogoltabida]ALH82623.1 hypothetical protein AN936_20365 [Sphingopyxis macrogoltabida]ALJ15913.1 hypothetical protein LH19_23805 [Sphingopyxis macrogoltabida]AMU92153.1 hypothetical protein ATM17_24365 [Sphingopyxis macrogoltabida]